MTGRLPPPSYVIAEEKNLVKRLLEKVVRNLPVALLGLVGVLPAILFGKSESWLEALLREVYNWVFLAALAESAIEAVAEHFIIRKLESYVESTPTGLLARALKLPIKDEVLKPVNPVYWAVRGRTVIVEEASRVYTIVTIDVSPISIAVKAYRAKPDNVVYTPLDKYRGVKLKKLQEGRGKPRRKYSKGGSSILKELARTIREGHYIEETPLNELEFPSPSNPYTLVKCRGPVVSAMWSVFHVNPNPVKFENDLSRIVSRTLDEVVKAFDELLSSVKDESKAGREKRV